jgi:hypothetical protein
MRPDPLQESRSLFLKGNYVAFYTELNRALWNEMAEKLQIRASSLNKQNIAQRLHDIGWTESETALVQQTLNECEVRLYTPDHDESDLQRILKDAEIIMGMLEKQPQAQG